MVLRRMVGPAMIDGFDLREPISPSLCGDGVSLDWWCAQPKLSVKCGFDVDAKKAHSWCGRCRRYLPSSIAENSYGS